MNDHANIPVGLPVDNPTESFWQCPPDDIANLQSSELPATADVVIVGSGITGAAVAWRLLSEQRDRSVVMLEAREACSGASGRNGGHTKAASYRSFPSHASSLGTRAACQIARLELANIKATHAFAREHAIPCDSNPCQTVDVVYDPAQWAFAQDSVASMRAAMPGDEVSEYVFHAPEEVSRRFFCGDEGGAGKVCGGIEYFAGSVSAYAFGVGVLKLGLALGLNLQTRTPALSVDRLVDGADGHRWAVATSRGTVLARSVVLATNAYTAFLRPRFRGVIVPLRGQVTAQRPGSSMPRPALATTYSFVYEKGYEYMIPRPPGSRFGGGIIIGGGLVRAPDEGLGEYGTTDDASTNEVIGEYLRGSLLRYFGDNWGEDDAKGRVFKEWTGIMGYSPDGMPFVGEMPALDGASASGNDHNQASAGVAGGNHRTERVGQQGAEAEPKEEGLWICAGFQGHGMVYCWECARALVEMMSGRDDATLRSWFPDAFRIMSERFEQQFRGRLHTSGGANED